MATAETKTALLQAAKQLVVERGYGGASVRDLAALSGANPAAINYHFGSRENLLNQAILDIFVEWADRAAAQGPADPEAEPLQQLAARARPAVDGIPAARPAFVISLEALLQAQRSPELHRQLSEHYGKLRQHAIEEMRSTERGRELPQRFLEVVASYMLAVVDGLQLQALLDPQVIPTGEELANFYEALAAAARAAGTQTTDPGRDNDDA